MYVCMYMLLEGIWISTGTFFFKWIRTVLTPRAHEPTAQIYDAFMRFL